MCLAAAACGGGTSGSAGGGPAQLNRPVDLIVPFGPGGGSDQVGRAVAQGMAKSLGTDVPVVNVEGGTGNTGLTKMLASAPGDSASVLIQDTLATVSAGVSAFEFNELTGVCRLQSMPSALLVKKDAYQDWEDLAAAAEDKPGELTVATVGRNSVDDIVLAALAKTQGAKFRAVPFSEPTERYSALLGGSVDAMYEQLGDVRQYLDSGDFVPVMIFSQEAVPGFEDVPLATELGVPADTVLPQFRGLVVDSETPPPTVEALSDACSGAVRSAKFQKFQKEVFATPDSYQSADEFQTFLKTQNSKIGGQLKQYGIGS
ncbi:MAG: tripartite tricarboxylate transporter substrate binding protein [Streptomycetales bacterium]